MKFIVFNILFANLLAIGTIKSKAAIHNPPSGDTVVVKLKNKNKVMIITAESKNLKSFLNVNLNQIIADIDSSFRRDSTLSNGGEMELALFQKDSLLKIRILKDVIRNSYKAVLEVREKDDSSQKTFQINSWYGKKEKRKNRIDDIFEIDLGWNNYLESGKIPADENKPYGLKPLSSNVISLRAMKNFYWSKEKPRFSTSVGVEISWNNYKYDNSVIITKGSESVSFDPFLADQRMIKSKLTVSWLNVPVMMHYRSRNSSFHFALGGFSGYRLGSHSKTKFDEKGSTKKDHVNTNFYLNSLQYGARVQVGFYGIDFFGQYNLNELFSKNKGPALTPISFGITI